MPMHSKIKIKTIYLYLYSGYWIILLVACPRQPKWCEWVVGFTQTGHREKSSKKVTDTYGLFDCHEPMTHPSPGGSVTANVGKALLVVPIRSTKRYFFYCLINNHAL